jgi:hypothetical protein
VEQTNELLTQFFDRPRARARAEEVTIMRKVISFEALQRMSGAAFDAIQASVSNDPLEVNHAMLESSCDRLVKLGGAALLVSDLRALLADYQAVADAENNARARADWMAAHRRPGGGE